MLARVVYNVYQGGHLNRLCFKNVGSELLPTANKKQIHPWSKSYIHFYQYRNMSKDGNKPDALVKDLVGKQLGKNYNSQIKPKLIHATPSKLDSIKTENINAKVQKKNILQEIGDKILQQGIKNVQSCKILRKTGSGAKCFVINKENKKPFKKTVAFDLRPRVLHQSAIPFQFTKIHCIKPCENLVGILKKSKDNVVESLRNVCQKPYIIKESIYCALQSQTRNFCQNRGEDGSTKTDTEHLEKFKDIQDVTKKQITSQIPEKNAQLNQNEKEHQQSPIEIKKIKYIHAFHPSLIQKIDNQPNTLKKEHNVLLRTASKSLSNLNTCEKSLVKIPGTIQSKEISKLCRHRHRLCRGPSLARSDNRIAFSTSSGDYTDRNKCKSDNSMKRKRKHAPSQHAKRRKSEVKKQDGSEDKCFVKNAEERSKLIKSCSILKEEKKNPDELAKLLESCFPQSEKSCECDYRITHECDNRKAHECDNRKAHECDNRKTQTSCRDSATKDKQSKPHDKCKETPEKNKSTKPKCEKNDKRDNVIDIGCKSSLQKLCTKITNQLTEYHETQKKKNKKKKPIDPCDMTCRDVCADDCLVKDGEILPGVKRDCRFVCEDGKNACDPPKPKKPPKPKVQNVCKEIISKQMQMKKKKCSITPQTEKKTKKCRPQKSPELTKKTKVRKKSSCPDVCLWFQRTFRKKPQIYSGDCDKPKKKSQRMKVCESSFKKMLRKMQKRKTC